MADQTVAQKIYNLIKLSGYVTSYKWVNPHTGNKLPKSDQGIKYQSFFSSDESGTRYQYILVEDSKANGSSFYTGLFKIKDLPSDQQNIEEPISVYEATVDAVYPDTAVSSNSEEVGTAKASAKKAIQDIKKNSKSFLDSTQPSEDKSLQDTVNETSELPTDPQDPNAGTELPDASDETEVDATTGSDEEQEVFTYKYTDQQVLMASLPKILDESKEYFSEPPKYYMMTTDTEAETSPTQRMKKVDKSSIKSMLEMTTIQASSLLPKIELWKIYSNDQGEITDEVYIPYTTDSKNFIRDIFNNKQTRGDDVGIRNINFVYDNQNPATAERLLGATIEFQFQNAETLVRDRNGFKYAELFFYDQTESSEIVDRDKYDIILKIGYETEGKNQSLVPKSLKDSLKSQDQIRRNMVVHHLAI